MKRIKYVAYHDSKPVYVACGKQLAESLEAVGITDYHIEQYDRTWEFKEACAFKPWFIAGCMMLFNDYDAIVYLDVDAIVIQYPELFDKIDKSFDIGAHYKDGHELLSGTLYFNNSMKVLEFLMAWSGKCRDNPRIWDQRHLQQLINDRPDMTLYCLPSSYCQIFDATEISDDAVIKHMQASRFSRGIDLNHNPIQERSMWIQ